MLRFTGFEPKPLRELEGEIYHLAQTLFAISTTAEEFVDAVDTLHNKGFDLNGLHNNGVTVGHAGLTKGERAVIFALDDAGYDFSRDPAAMDYARDAWHGSLFATVARSARKYDPAIQVPPLEDEAAREATEMAHPSLRNIRIIRNAGWQL